MFTAKLKPTRMEAQPDPMKIICDFDTLLEQKIGFKYRNKIYSVGDLTVENYMQVTVAYRDLMALIESRSQGGVSSEEEVYRTYYTLIHSLCSEFPYEELLTMPFQALNHLIHMILKKVSGDTSFFEKKETEKKNSLNPKIS